METTIIWNQFKAELLNFITYKVSDKMLAEDILQDVFIKIHQKRKSLSDDSKLHSWIYQITRNSIIDFYRKKKLSTDSLLEHLELPEEVDDVEENIKACTECVKPFILELPEKYKDVLYNVTYGNVSQKEYAIMNDLTYSTVKTRVQRGREQLKHSFETCCDAVEDIQGNISYNCKNGCNN
ncbi:MULTISPECIES: sigma-70 family RNA polymerase sigma factor [Flammeovirga]|uniref:Sigma-70 family RNA polymerase sigma factor n=1 Tax=Flammeovirga agarivorans TaxID=2726742 RepID=A0A7X8SQJ8_9BACT|nr:MULTISPECIES: sigma-70 family RNA polymerase sigma factor [Flammeovirga]NLR94572.1 sigma-70 family RNA polymerase sigma factor [Flammeovirga agarivorans]